MSQHEVFVAVSAIVAAFHDGADLVAQIQRRRKRQQQQKRRGSESQDEEREAEMRRLQVSLQTAETQVAYHYAAMNKIGDIVRIGDGIARDRLHHVVAVVQTDVIASLQLAAEYQNAVLDWPILQESVIVNRKDTVEALDELRQRICLSTPPQSPPPPSREISSSTSPRISRNSRGSLVSVLPSHNPNPSAAATAKEDANLVSIPASRDRYSSAGAERDGGPDHQRHKARSSCPPSLSTTNTSHDFHPALDFLLQSKTPEERAAIMEEIDELIIAYQNLHFKHNRESAMATLNGKSKASKRDTLAMLMGLGGDHNGGHSTTTPLDQAALQLLRSPTATSWEAQEDRDYIFSNSNSSSGAGTSDSNSAVPALRRWSTSSSIYSDHTILSDPPSLYRYGSTSSHESDNPAEPPSPVQTGRYQPFQQRPKSFQHAGTSLWDMTRHLQAPTLPTPPDSARLDSLGVAPLAVRSRPTTPTTPTNALRPVDDKPLPPVPQSYPTLEATSSLPAPHSTAHLMPDSVLHRTTSTPQSRSATPSSRPTTPIHSSASRPVSPARSPSPYRPITPCVVTTITSTATTNLLSGRPCKENDYWGFCKGSWTIREDARKGLSLETRPTGMYSTMQIWQCKQCRFEGPTFAAPPSLTSSKRLYLHGGGKKDITFDPRIHKSSSGIRYRWLFLAKSHIRQTAPSSRAAEVASFACVICTAEKTLSGVFGGVETLMNHIFLEHARPGRVPDPAVLKQVGCVAGRVAAAEEEWDLNFAGEERCVVLF